MVEIAWTIPPVFSVGQVLGAASLNAMSADLTDLDLRTRLSNNTILTSQTTTSATYTDLATTGPQVTMTTGALAMVEVTAYITGSNVAAQYYMGFAVTGASSVAASDATAYMVQAATGSAQQGTASYLTIVTPGSNVFTAKYRASAGTGTFANREMTVWPGGNVT